MTDPVEEKSAFGQKVRKAIRFFPLWLRKATRDTLVGFVSALLVTSNLPANVSEAGLVSLLIGLGVAAGNAFARNSGDFFKWLDDVLSTATLKI